jgi:drug/metabolite transporter (DMT)-like permease
MWGEACALSAAAIWSFSVVLFKQSERISPQGMNLFKNVTALALLTLTMPLLGVSFDMTRSGEDWLRLAVSGVLGIAVADTLVFMALRRLGASLLAVVDCVYAPTIVLMSVLLLKEPIAAGFVGGAVLVIGGVLLATTDKIVRTPEEIAKNEKLRGGVACGIAGIVAMAVGVVLAKPVLEQGHLVEVTTVRLVAGVGAQLMWMALLPSQREALQAFRPDRAWRTLIPASVLGSYVAMLLWLGGFKWAPASVASVLNQMSTVFTIILARIILKEAISPRRALGALAAVAGAAWIIAS